jgi:hypothetical protein
MKCFVNRCKVTYLFKKNQLWKLSEIVYLNYGTIQVYGKVTLFYVAFEGNREQNNDNVKWNQERK